MSYRADRCVDRSTDGCTHTQMQATTIPGGQNWPRVIKELITLSSENKILTGYGRYKIHKVRNSDFQTFSEIIWMLQCVSVAEGLFSEITFHIHHQSGGREKEQLNPHQSGGRNTKSQINPGDMPEHHHHIYFRIRVLSMSHAMGLAAPGYAENWLSEHLCLVGQPQSGHNH